MLLKNQKICVRSRSKTEFYNILVLVFSTFSWPIPNPCLSLFSVIEDSSMMFFARCSVFRYAFCLISWNKIAITMGMSSLRWCLVKTLIFKLSESKVLLYRAYWTFSSVTIISKDSKDQRCSISFAQPLRALRIIN